MIMKRGREHETTKNNTIDGMAERIHLYYTPFLSAIGRALDRYGYLLFTCLFSSEEHLTRTGWLLWIWLHGKV